MFVGLLLRGGGTLLRLARERSPPSPRTRGEILGEAPRVRHTTVGSTSTPSDTIPVASAVRLNALNTPNSRRSRGSGYRPVAVRIPRTNA